MISRKSISYFVGLNAICISAGTLEYYIYTMYSPYLLLISILLKNLGITYILFYSGQDVEYIVPRENYILRYIDLSEIFYKSIFDLISLCIITRNYTLATVSMPYELAVFIPTSFVFEIGFDFFHYVTHRSLHSIPFLYRLTHKYHHQEYAINVLTTFQHSTLDLIASNLIPLICISLIYPLPLYTYIIWLWYKTIVEIGGHSGKYGKSSSLPQCIWIPRLLGIELYSHNHNKHHTHPNTNFSKRFSLWDKVFGTFSDGGPIEGNRVLSG